MKPMNSKGIAASKSLDSVSTMDGLYQFRNKISPRVAALGDSSVFGIGDSGSEIPSVGAGWAGRLAHDIGAGAFINLAKNGARARDLTQYQAKAAFAFNADLVLVCIGTNDVLRGDFSEKEIRCHMLTLTSQIIKQGGIVIILGLPDPLDTAPGPSSLLRILSRRMAAINQVLSDISDSKKIYFVGTWGSPMATDRKLWHVDRFHPSAIGHQFIADYIRRKLSIPRKSTKKLPIHAGYSKSYESFWLITNGLKWFLKRSVDLIPALVMIFISEYFQKRKP